VDEAFLRRIRYKIKIDQPSENQFREIFSHVCSMNGIPEKPEVLDHLVQHWYRRHDMPFNACHPRDLVDHIIDAARYFKQTPELTREAIDQACENYFVEN
jgi:SpoVK/Ycf46/Vps4 family AAA+-type ATPase